MERVKMSPEERKRRNVEGNRRWRQANRERVRAYSKARYDADPERAKADQAAYRERHRDRRRAQTLIGKRIERGTLVRPDHCDECRVPCFPEAHHDDYSKPDAVRFLCRDCHRSADAARQARDRENDARTAEHRNRTQRPSRAA